MEFYTSGRLSFSTDGTAPLLPPSRRTSRLSEYGSVAATSAAAAVAEAYAAASADADLDGDSSSSRCSRFCNVLKTFTVEVTVFVHAMYYVACTLMTQNLTLDRACRVNLNYSERVCDLIAANQVDNLTEEVDATHAIAANIQTWIVPIHYVLPMLMILFLGPWSDRHGRKPCIIIPFVGYITVFVLLGVNVRYFPEWPAEAIALCLYGPTSLAGGHIFLNLGINSLLTDKTNQESRTFRLGVLNMCLPMGAALGAALGGTVYRLLGYFWMYFTGMILEMVLLFLVILFVHDIKRVSSKERNCCSDLIDPSNTLAAAKTLFKRREGNERLKLILLMVVALLAILPLTGQSSVMYLFTRKQLNWDEVKYGIFNLYSFSVIASGSFITMWIFSYKLKCDDSLIGAMACVSLFASSFVYAFATSSWMMYLGPLVDSVNGVILYVGRAMPTKIVNDDEIGKINTIIGVLESAMPMVSVPLYSQIYAWTLEFFPGTIFLCTAVIIVIPFIIYMWMFRDRNQPEELEPLLQKK